MYINNDNVQTRDTATTDNHGVSVFTPTLTSVQLLGQNSGSAMLWFYWRSVKLLSSGRFITAISLHGQNY